MSTPSAAVNDCSSIMPTLASPTWPVQAVVSRSRDDVSLHADVGLDSEQENLRRIHPEVADVEGRLALPLERAGVAHADHRHLVLHRARDAAERDVTSNDVPIRRSRRTHVDEHALNARVPPRV